MGDQNKHVGQITTTGTDGVVSEDRVVGYRIHARNPTPIDLRAKDL